MGMPHRFFYNCRFLDAESKINTSARSKYNAYDLTTFLTHELGHIYGFGEGGCNRRVCDTCFQDENFRRDHPVRIDRTAPQEHDGQSLQLTILSCGALIRVQIYDVRGRIVEEIPAHWYNGETVTVKVPEHVVAGVYFWIEVDGTRCVRTIIIP